MRNKLVITLIIIGLLVVYFIFVTDYMTQLSANKDLATKINDVTDTLEKRSLSIEAIREKLSVAQGTLTVEQSKLPKKLNTTQVVYGVLNLAEEHQLKTTLVVQPWSKVSIGEHSYYVLQFNMVVEGHFSQLLGFLSELENGEYRTLALEQLTVRKGNDEVEQIDITDGVIPITAEFDVAIYSRFLEND